MKKKTVPCSVHFTGGKTVKYSKLRFRFTVRVGECQRVIEHSVPKKTKTPNLNGTFSLCVYKKLLSTHIQPTGRFIAVANIFRYFFPIVFVFRSKIFNRYKQQKQKKNTYALLATESNNILYGICSGAWNFGGRIERGEQKKTKELSIVHFQGYWKVCQMHKSFCS